MNESEIWRKRAAPDYGRNAGPKSKYEKDLEAMSAAKQVVSPGSGPLDPIPTHLQDYRSGFARTGLRHSECGLRCTLPDAELTPRVVG